MRQYELLSEERVRERRTIADAVDVLHELLGFDEGKCAEIRIGRLRLPADKLVGLVAIVYEPPHQEKGYVVRLPASTEFEAIPEGASVRKRFDIFRLDGAAVTADSGVRLEEGIGLRAVEVKSTRFLGAPSKLDWRIVHLTLSHIEGTEHCYRSLREGLPLADQSLVPDHRFLDCSRLIGLALPPLKVIASRIKEKDSTLGRLSTQKIADALSKFGIRPANPRPRLSSSGTF